MPAEPLILALETATPAAGVALACGERVIAERALTGENARSERLLSAVNEVLRDSGRALEAVEALGVSIGPGSFTGLRVGLATAKGLCFGTARPAVPVPTLRALAYGAAAGRPVAALLDARRGELYAAVYAADGSELIVESVYPAEDLAPRLPGGCVLVGEHAEALAAAAGRGVRAAEPALPRAPARAVAVLAARRLAGGERPSADGLVPRYLLRAEAEARRLGRRLE